MRMTKKDPFSKVLFDDGTLMEYQTQVDYKGTKVTLTIDDVTDLDQEELHDLMEKAHEFYLHINDWIDKAWDFAVHELTWLKNDSWLGEGEAEISEEEFRKRMKLDHINFGLEETFFVCFEDGDLFWGHEIVVMGDLTDGCTDADIEG